VRSLINSDRRRALERWKVKCPNVAAITRNAAERERNSLDGSSPKFLYAINTHKFLPGWDERVHNNGTGHVTRKNNVWLFIIIKYMNKLVVFRLAFCCWGSHVLPFMILILPLAWETLINNFILLYCIRTLTIYEMQMLSIFN
jgi:hypothetical protein